jgi:hypothetical protein
VVGFARVKAILDQGIATWEHRAGNHAPANLSVHGSTFSWATKAALLAAEGHGRRLIAPEVIGNGKGAQAVLVIDLRTGVAGPATRMPHGGPYLPDSQIQEIEDWINAGCPD